MIETGRNSTPDEQAFNIKELWSIIKAAGSGVTSAQVDVWLATHKGSLDEALHVIGDRRGDAAIGQMMLHRRRAVVARVIGEFFSHLGSRFSPYLGRRVPESVAIELGMAKAAGDPLASVNGSAPALLFERASIAEAEGRYADALDDLEALRREYPGFLAAAIASARVALMNRDPGRAVRSLVCLESEVVGSRAGTCLLADALHALGMHEAASRYDVIGLMCPGHSDSRGNDCAPIDVTGKVAVHSRMPLPFLVGVLPDGRVLCNDRGLYYIGPSDGDPRTNLMRARSDSPSTIPRRAAWWARRMAALLRSFFRALLRLVRSLPKWLAGGSVVRSRAASDAVTIRPPTRRDLQQPARKTSHGLRKLVASRVTALRRSTYYAYKRLPKPLRYSLNKFMLLPLRGAREEDWQQVPEQDSQSAIICARLRHGITNILQSSSEHRGAGVEQIAISESRSATEGFTSDLKQLMELTRSSDLPQPAAEVFIGLLNGLCHRTSDAAAPSRISDK